MIKTCVRDVSGFLRKIYSMKIKDVDMVNKRIVGNKKKMYRKNKYFCSCF